MADITETETKFLNELVKDCITYRLTTQEAIRYIASRFKQISPSSYKLRKAKVLSDKSNQIWLDYYTRVGFVKHHKEQIDSVQTIQNYSLNQFFIEIHKRSEERNETKIRYLMYDIRENAKLLSEIGMGTTIISSIKSKVERANQLIRTAQNNI
jgi:hypothetical protein